MLSIHERFNSWFVQKILPSATMAITLYPFIFYRMTEATCPRSTRRHEWEHISQVRTYGWLHFYANYLLQLIRHGYWAISWEIEAYADQEEAAWPANTPDHPAI
jgi:hypothetical protein